MINKKLNCILLAMDNGLANMKMKCGDDEIIYFNGIEVGHKDSIFLDKNTKNVVFNGVNYLVGNMAKSNSVLEGKGSEESVIKALTGISKFCKPTVKKEVINKVFLMYGESVNKYLNEKHRVKLQNSLQKQHTIIIDGLTYIIDIELIHLLPEGVGYSFLSKENRLGKKYIVDMGGTTINYLVLNNGVMDTTKSTSLNANGKHRLVSEIKKDLSRKFSIDDIDSDQISLWIEKKVKCDSRFQTVIDECVENHLKAFDTAVSTDGTSLLDVLQYSDVVFLGGTSILLKEYIVQRYRSEYRSATVLTDEDSLFSTVRGFYTLGVALHSDKLGLSE